MKPKLVVLRRYPAMIHAELAKSALDAYGVASAINGGLFGSQHEWPGRTIDLMVREQDVEEALAILGPEEKFTD
jgi:hypothetical protein